MRRARARARDVETGGVLFGQVRGDAVVVLHASPPPRDSRATRTSFVRGTQGVLAMLQRRWKRGEYYVGEWHAHPETFPSASPQDKQSLHDIVADGSLVFAAPMLVIAGGPIARARFAVYVRWVDGVIEELRLK